MHRYWAEHVYQRKQHPSFFGEQLCSEYNWCHRSYLKYFGNIQTYGNYGHAEMLFLDELRRFAGFRLTFL